jgi:hypothetical protein
MENKILCFFVTSSVTSNKKSRNLFKWDYSFYMVGAEGLEPTTFWV